MFWLITSSLILINFSPILLRSLDIWTAQSIFIQFCASLMFCLLFKNIPLRMFMLWAVIQTFGWFLVLSMNNKINTFMTQNIINIFLAGVIYLSIVNFLNRNHICKIVDYLRYLVISQLIVCVLQFIGYSQFFVLLYPGSQYFNNLVVGYIGQPTHLAALLAMSAPLFLVRRNTADILSLILMGLVLLTTGTTKGDPSSTGLLIYATVILFYLFHSDRWLFWIFMTFVSVSSAFILTPKFFNPHGRYEIWLYYLGLFQQMPITGAGLGIVHNIAQTTPHPKALQLHNEFLQIALELGLIGLLLFLNMIVEFFKQKSDSEIELCFKSIILGFLINSFFLFPMHLWLPSTLAIFAYAGFKVMKGDYNARIDFKTNKGSSLSYV